MRVVLIAGPTASGKSSAAIGVAEKCDGVIINADSMQVYRELDVLTSRPSRADEQRVEHRLYGYLPASERCNVARWLEDAGREIKSVLDAGRTAVIAGGTGLYFKALESGLAPVPEIPGHIRTGLKKQLADEGAEALHRKLSQVDEAGAERLKPNDSQRILRALEVVQSTGKPLAYFHQVAAETSVLAGLEVHKFVLSPPRELLYGRINTRFDEMLAQGALEEVEKLRALQLSDDLPAMKAIGVRSLGSYLDGGLELDKAVEIAKQETRNYAKRQMTWQRNQMTDWRAVNELSGFTF